MEHDVPTVRLVEMEDEVLVPMVPDQCVADLAGTGGGDRIARTVSRAVPREGPRRPVVHGPVVLDDIKEASRTVTLDLERGTSRIDDLRPLPGTDNIRVVALDNQGAASTPVNISMNVTPGPGLVPAPDPVTSTEKVQELDGGRFNAEIPIVVLPGLAIISPPQLPARLLGLATKRPTGKRSLAETFTKVRVVFGLVKVKVRIIIIMFVIVIMLAVRIVVMILFLIQQVHHRK